MELPYTEDGNCQFVQNLTIREDLAWFVVLQRIVDQVSVDPEPNPEQELIVWCNEIRAGRPLAEILSEAIKANIRDSETEAS